MRSWGSDCSGWQTSVVGCSTVPLMCSQKDSRTCKICRHSDVNRSEALRPSQYQGNQPKTPFGCRNLIFESRYFNTPLLKSPQATAVKEQVMKRFAAVVSGALMCVLLVTPAFAGP